MYKLTYFDITALGEPIRLILTYGKMEFEDNRVTFEEWPMVKLNMPFGQVPVLEHDGKVMNQSLAICRYLAKLTKLDGSSDWENLEIDAAAETISDLRTKIGLFYYEKDSLVKEAKKKEVFEEILPFYLEKIEAQIQKNEGHLACKKLTWADFYLIGILDYVNMMLDVDLAEKYPGIKIIQDKLLDIDDIKNWFDEHPRMERKKE
ncbi:unnamed protein product [Phyllotreta striolata]|uniref:glutathione transferase n=1 Tax=Phyllotreta striolata TaxID=444603 RepID=A0A9N9TPK1_PHYSR|nr:unnamed protein product [Phyllotreta striolata]